MPLLLWTKTTDRFCSVGTRTQLRGQVHCVTEYYRFAVIWATNSCLMIREDTSSIINNHLLLYSKSILPRIDIFEVLHFVRRQQPRSSIISDIFPYSFIALMNRLVVLRFSSGPCIFQTTVGCIHSLRARVSQMTVYTAYYHKPFAYDYTIVRIRSLLSLAI